MTGWTRIEQAKATDSLAMDRYPECPKCGNLCGRLARVCYDCGTHLFDDVTNAGQARRLAPGASSPVGSDAMQSSEVLGAARESVS